MSEDTTAASGRGMDRQQQVEALMANRYRIAEYLMSEEGLTYGEARKQARQQQVAKLVDKKGFSKEEALELTADVPVGEKRVTHQDRQQQVEQLMVDDGLSWREAWRRTEDMSGSGRNNASSTHRMGRQEQVELLIAVEALSWREAWRRTGTSAVPGGQEGVTGSTALAGWGIVGVVLVGVAWVLFGVALSEVGYMGLLDTDLGEYPGNLSAWSMPFGLVGLVICLIVLIRGERALRNSAMTTGRDFLQASLSRFVRFGGQGPSALCSHFTSIGREWKPVGLVSQQRFQPVDPEAM